MESKSSGICYGARKSALLCLVNGSNAFSLQYRVWLEALLTAAGSKQNSAFLAR